MNFTPLILTDAPATSKITLHTSKGTEIDNIIGYNISAFERNQFADYRKEKNPTAIFRSSPSPQYNCHGMSFACRRTNVTRTEDVKKILTDDEYHELNPKDTMPGDLVLYINAEDGDIVHSGMVVKAIHSQDDLSQITVIGKWGKFREVIHDVNDGPYKQYTKKYYKICHYEYESENQSTRS